MNAVSAMPRRILALWFPRLPADRVRRKRFGPAWRIEKAPEGPGLVFWRREGNADRLAAVDEKAATLGLSPGMALADARAMHPGLEILEEDVAADGRLLSGLADWCDRYTPLVAFDGEDGLFLDITGCAHLFGGEKAMLADTLSRLMHLGFAVRGALASTAGAAHAAARFSGTAIVEPGGEQSLLEPLPLACLRLEPATRAGLESVGLKTVAQLGAAPRAPLARRFGATLLVRLDRALGRLDEPLSPRLALPLVSAERRLAEPVSRTEDIEHLVFMLARSLAGELERRGEGARLVELALYRLDGAVSRLAVGASRPMRDPAALKRLFRERLAALGDDLDAGFGFDMARLSVMEVAAFDERQERLDGDRTEAPEEALALLTDRIRARLGAQALLAPTFVDSRLPERAARLTPIAALPAAAPPPVGDDTVAPESDSVRPLRLFAPAEPVEAVAEVPDGPPVRFRWRRALYRIARAEGPERLAPEWWRGDAGRTRDYYRVEDETGRRWWLCRHGLYGETAEPRWYLQGAFA